MALFGRRCAQRLISDKERQCFCENYFIESESQKLFEEVCETQGAWIEWSYTEVALEKKKAGGREFIYDEYTHSDRFEFSDSSELGWR